MSKWIVDIHGDIEGDYEIIEKYKEPKTAYWLPYAEENGKTVKWVCSSCRRVKSITKDKTDYCPACGAKMVEPQESEIHCKYTDEEIAKSFIEDVEAVKDLLPRAESEESDEVSD